MGTQRIFGMNLTKNIIFIVCLLALAKPVQASYRIFCSPNSDGGRTIDTLRSDVIPEYLMPSVYISNPEGQIVKSAIDFAPIKSDDLSSELYVVASDQNDNLSLLKVNLDIVRRSSQSKLVTKLATPTGVIYGVIHNSGLKYKIISYDPQTGLLIYPDYTSKKYVLVNTNTNEQKVLNDFAISVFANPRFVSNYIVFDSLNKNLTLTQSAISNDLKTKITLPEQDTRQLYLTPLENGQYAWIQSSNKVTSKSKWFLKFSNSQSVELGPEVNISASSFLFHQTEYQQLRLFFSEEYYEPTSDNKGVPARKIINGGINIQTYDLQNLQQLKTSKINYTENVLDYLNKQTIRQDGLLKNALINPESNQLIFGLNILSGMISLNISTEKWNFHATRTASQCYNAIGIQGENL